MLALEGDVRERLDQFLATGVAQNPRRVGKALDGKLKGFWRYRIGIYRILCRIEDERLRVVVVAVGPRDHIYRTLPP
jgi:mRNA interferase RelE/StbE